MGTVYLTKEKECAIAAAVEAGGIIRAIYHTEYAIDYKGKDGPVTRADREANQKIHAILQGAFPQYGWLSEETVDSPARLSCRRVWVVDPLDGTKEFIQKIPEFAVSIALVEEGMPVLGVAYNPLGKLYWAVRGQGAWCEGQRLQVSPVDRLTDATILSSRSETKRGEWDVFKGVFRMRPTGSIAYKLSLIAAGEADASFTLVQKNEWDICAGVLLVEEAGGKVSNLDGSPVFFNQPKTLLPGLIASNHSLYDQLLQLIAQKYAGRPPARK
ncbi:MAG TPA: 3'(2'),5'-bisphosphate nucleotidase CysQ [Methylomirabilota bacterium]|jgi:myo-inositol-1(or 4)-monophosphatase|nr:3'(2'),5'-bisphosphate nucleotidase CysQ [Methylomirabilota bacterium]